MHFGQDSSQGSIIYLRSKQHRLGVDSFLLEGQEPNIIDYNLNISHRIAYDEVIKKNS